MTRVWREQAITVPVPSEDLVLEAVWQAGDRGGAVIAPAHPLHGGSFDHPVMNEVAYALSRAGLASVRFNWRGVGASQGVASADAGEAERDFSAGLDLMEHGVSGPIVGAGYSFGAATALRVGLRDPRVHSLLLVAPPLEMIRDLSLETFKGPLQVIVGGADAWAPAGELSSLLAPLPNARLEVIPETDHFFSARGLSDLFQLVVTAQE